MDFADLRDMYGQTRVMEGAKESLQIGFPTFTGCQRTS